MVTQNPFARQTQKITFRFRDSRCRRRATQTPGTILCIYPLGIMRSKTYATTLVVIVATDHEPFFCSHSDQKLHAIVSREISSGLSSCVCRDLFSMCSKSVPCQLRDIWSAYLENNKELPITLDVLSWLSRATLDIIGLAGTHYGYLHLENPTDRCTHRFWLRIRCPQHRRSAKRAQRRHFNPLQRRRSSSALHVP